MKTQTLHNWALIFSLLGTSAFIAGCDAASSSNNAAVENTTASAASSAAFQISQFYPASGTVSSIPTSVTAIFNESNFSSSEISNTANWIMSCPTGAYYASAITVSGNYAFITFPSPSSLAPGESCTLEVNGNMSDNSGNVLGGTETATYALSSNAVEISSFSPAAGSYSTLPSTVQVAFNNTDLLASTVTNVSNWTVTCGSDTAVNPISVTYSSNVATVTMPAVEGVSAGTACILAASTAITDTSGNSIAGTLSASYTLTQSLGQPIGYILTPVTNDRVYGTITAAASAYGTGLTPITISSVMFYLIDSNSNEIVIGKATVNSSGYYSITANTAGVKNGLYTLAISVTDTAGYTVSEADSVTIDIENHGQTETLREGGTSGISYTDLAPSGSNMIGLQVAAGSSVNALLPVWQSAFGNSQSTSEGSVHGGAGGTASSISCPATGNYRVTGVYGYVGSSYINQLGLVCQEQYNETGTSTTTKTSTVGSASGTAFELDCPEGTFVVGLAGNASASALNSAIELVCQ